MRQGLNYEMLQSLKIKQRLQKIYLQVASDGKKTIRLQYCVSKMRKTLQVVQNVSCLKC